MRLSATGPRRRAAAQRAGVAWADVELPEVHALPVGTSRAAAHAHLDVEVTQRMLAIVFDGLAPR